MDLDLEGHMEEWWDTFVNRLLACFTKLGDFNNELACGSQNLIEEYM